MLGVSAYQWDEGSGSEDTGGEYHDQPSDEEQEEGRHGLSAYSLSSSDEDVYAAGGGRGRDSGGSEGEGEDADADADAASSADEGTYATAGGYAAYIDGYDTVPSEKDNNSAPGAEPKDGGDDDDNNNDDADNNVEKRSLLLSGVTTSLPTQAHSNVKQQRLFFSDSGSRDWNAELQALLERPFSDRERWVFLREVANEFVSTAVSLGRIIVSEQGLPESQKTIKSVSMGGVAGGDKWSVSGIM
jgi:hypothetical protein